MSYELLSTWILVVMVGNALPGPDFFCISSVSLRSRRLGLLTALGLQTGVLTHSIVSYFFSIAIATYNYTLFEIIQFIGSCYLLYIAYLILSSALKRRRELNNLYAQAKVEGKDLAQIDKDIQIQAANSMSGFKAYRLGLFTNLLNPKCFIFMATVLPQFVDASESFSLDLQMFILYAVNLALGIIHWTVVAFLVSYLADKFSSASFRIKLELVGGVCLLIIAGALFVHLAWWFIEMY
ncbi:hypothetical protein CKF54_02475 [Psittacicella hinzii]|uniref:Threonine/homoserine/homoserine lactone efflux protein n=1 Tax=Psittacicella hinzii TaxID=2028575 RepID=A0A3A1YBL9_9GAMM|nr:LysE family translocator [Psittacicella hinzii]RIY33604.1 hypothetical protein CKF54_02475 [Psittacicella hinzii]